MRIGIIGGGISGLTLSIALQQKGFSPIVYEQAEELTEIGAGIWLQPNAMYVMNRLGLANKLLSAGCILNRVDITDANLVSFKPTSQNMIRDEDGNSILAIHRWRLQKALYDHAIVGGQVKKGYSLSGLHENQHAIRLEFSNGSIEEVDVLIGADGIHSGVRNLIGYKSAYRSSGQVCYRGIGRIRLPDELLASGRELWGSKRRFGFSQIYDGEVYWFSVLNQSLITGKADRDVLMEKYSGFHSVVNEIIKSTSEDEIHTAELNDLERLGSWSKNNICLIGDAAHATTPNMGQGAGQGIEDAFVLANCIASLKTNVNGAFTDFENKRRKKVDYIVNTSWRIGKMAHSPVNQFIMRNLMKITPDHVVENQMKKVYSVTD